jgi:hypothetical protein
MLAASGIPTFAGHQWPAFAPEYMRSPSANTFVDLCRMWSDPRRGPRALDGGFAQRRAFRAGNGKRKWRSLSEKSQS